MDYLDISTREANKLFGSGLAVGKKASSAAVYLSDRRAQVSQMKLLQRDNRTNILFKRNTLPTKAAQLKVKLKGLPNHLKSGVENLSAYSKKNVQLRAQPTKPQHISTASHLNVVQRVALTGSQMQGLIAHVVNNNFKGFSAKFRGVDLAQDEMISCRTTFDSARRLLVAGHNQNNQPLKDLLNTSSETRFPTAYMAHNMNDGSRMVHPTSERTLTYGAERSKKGNPRWTGHTTFDRGRRRHVDQGATITDKRNRAISYSLRYGAQPPFARNSRVKLDVNDPTHRQAHQERERLKSLHPDYNPAITQDYDAAWSPKRPNLTRAVSPVRRLPSMAAPPPTYAAVVKRGIARRSRYQPY